MVITCGRYFCSRYRRGRYGLWPISSSPSRVGYCILPYLAFFGVSHHAETTVAAEVEDSASCRPNSFCADSTPVGLSCMESDMGDEVNSDVDFRQDIETEAVSLVAGLNANSSVPYSIDPEVVESFNTMTASMISLVQSEVARCLTNKQIDQTVVSQVTHDVRTRLEGCTEPLRNCQHVKSKIHFLTSIFWVLHHNLYISAHNSSHTEVYLHMCMIHFSMLQLKRPSGVCCRIKIMSKLCCRTSVLLVFCRTGQMVPSAASTHFLVIQANFPSKFNCFYDDMGVTNPLRSHGSVHNVGMFYYTIKNLPPEFNSCFANVHLLALCYSHDLSVHGFEPVLNSFVAEMKDLSTAGLTGDFPVLGSTTIYVSLCQVTCDNLALNKMFGFIESFQAAISAHFAMQRVNKYRSGIARNSFSDVLLTCTIKMLMVCRVQDNKAKTLQGC